MQKILLAITLGALTSFVSITAANSQERREILPPSISVTGTGQIFARPDMAQISMGVTTEAPTASAALAQNNDKMSALMKALASKGVPERDVLTSNFSVFPEYRHDPSPMSSPQERRLPTIIGYRVNNEVHVRIRKLEDLGGILDEVIRSGANQVHGISFSIAEPAPVLDEARKKAVADARRKAELLAAASGTRLGKVLYINEGGGIMPPPRPMMMMEARAASSVPIASGEQEMSASVNVVYAIE